jgi:ubiquinone/menaquinone biosynthesis C-methylase UbiE
MSALSLTLDTPALAEHYEKASVDRQFKAGKELIEKLEIQPGQRVLDVGAGTGLLAEYVAGIVGQKGWVTAVDPLPLRIAIAKRKAKPNLTFLVGDAYDLANFGDAKFDVVYLNAVFHWFPEKTQPLLNFHRVLKRDGRIGISTGSKDHPSLVHAIQRDVLAREPYCAFVKPETGLPHRVSEHELRELLQNAGFAVRTLELSRHRTVHRSAEAALAHHQASSFGNLLGHLPPELQVRATEDIAAALQPHRSAEGFVLEGARIFATAVRL